MSIVERLNEDFLKQVKAKSEKIFTALQGASGVKSVSGLGLMIGIETEKSAKDVVAECMANGVLCLTAKTKVRLLPPLNIPEDKLDKAIEIIKTACAV